MNVEHGKKSDKLRDLKEKLEKQKKLASEYLNDLQRLQAEFENYKKRVCREKEDFIKYANEQLILKILDVIDNFERAIKFSEDKHKTRDLVGGMKLIQKQLQDILSDVGVEPIEAIGKCFDPHKHEALMQVNSNDHPEDTVIEEVQKGYSLGDKVIRPSRVKTSKKKEVIQNG